jgi:hypothetical protein
MPARSSTRRRPPSPGSAGWSCAASCGPAGRARHAGGRRRGTAPRRRRIAGDAPVLEPAAGRRPLGGNRLARRARWPGRRPRRAGGLLRGDGRCPGAGADQRHRGRQHRPAIMAFGTDEQQARFLRPMLRGDTIWSQGMSEPDSGSDLASLRTRAEPDGAGFVVNGQKTWNSLGHLADWCQLYVRTDPAAPRRGISCLLVDLRSPGIEVRPLRSMTGEVSFSELFFSDVHVPAEALLGPLHGGWDVAMTTLSHERAGVARFHLVLREGDPAPRSVRPQVPDAASALTERNPGGLRSLRRAPASRWRAPCARRRATGWWSGCSRRGRQPARAGHPRCTHREGSR